MLFVRETLVSYPDPTQLSVACSTGWGLGSAVSELPGYPGRQHARRAQKAYGWRKIQSLPLTIEI